MTEDSDQVFDERDYRTILAAGGSKALPAAKRAFGLFGFKSNFTMIVEHAMSLDYPAGDRFLPIRALHHSKHIKSFLGGQYTQLPILHSVMVSSGYGIARTIESSGSSLTSAQLVFETLNAIDTGAAARACSLAMQLALRGQDELLMDSLRDEAARRYSYSFPPSLAWNSVRCILSGSRLTENAARVLAASVASADISSDAIGAKKALQYAGISPEKAAENDFFTDSSVNKRTVISIRSGVPELTLRVIAEELRNGVSARHIIDTICLESLVSSMHSERKFTHEFLIQNSSSLLESIVSAGSVRPADVMEMMAIAAHLTQIYVSPPDRTTFHGREGTESLEGAFLEMEKGNSIPFIGIISGAKRTSDCDAASKFIAKLSVGCDQKNLYSESMCHCSSSLLAGTLLDSLDGKVRALCECASYLSSLKKRGAECTDAVSSIIRGDSTASEKN
jgi:hypothetical protein